MSDLCVYRLRLRGQVDAAALNGLSPLAIMVDDADAESTHFHVYTDQAGLIGLMRHLHALGFVFLAVEMEAPTPEYP